MVAGNLFMPEEIDKYLIEILPPSFWAFFVFLIN